jgi:hypothetical protein
VTEVTLIVKGERLTFSNRFRQSIFKTTLITVSEREQEQLKIYEHNLREVRIQGSCGTAHYADLTEFQIEKVKETFKVIAEMGTPAVHGLPQAA